MYNVQLLMVFNITFAFIFVLCGWDFASVSVHHMNKGLVEFRKSLGPLALELQSWEELCGFWELNLDPLENQWSLSIAEKSLQPPNSFFFIFFSFFSHTIHPYFSFPSLYYIWFYPTSWGYAISDSWPSWQYCKTHPSRGLRVKLDRSFVGYSYKHCTTITSAHFAGWKNCRLTVLRLCSSITTGSLVVLLKMASSDSICPITRSPC